MSGWISWPPVWWPPWVPWPFKGREITRGGITFGKPKQKPKPKPKDSIMASTAAVTIPDNATDTATLSFTDAAGQPATPAAAPVWTVDNTAIVTVAPAADGESAVFTPAGTDGTANVTVVAQGDPTPGVDVVTLTGTVTVTGGEIAAGAIVFGPPT